MNDTVELLPREGSPLYAPGQMYEVELLIYVIWGSTLLNV